jgi:hypothetical protein
MANMSTPRSAPVANLRASRKETAAAKKALAAKAVTANTAPKLRWQVEGDHNQKGTRY